MKNKLFIIVTCLALMTVGGTALAQPVIGGSVKPVSEIEVQTADNLVTRVSGLNRFSEVTTLRSPTSDLCGNGVIDTDPATGNAEECEFKDGAMIQSPDVASAYFPSCNPEKNETCNKDKCICEVVPICGDGLFAPKSEQCEAQLDAVQVTQDLLDKMCLRPATQVNRMSASSWFTPPALAEGAHYVCNDCICATCGNGVKDPGEECDGTQGCNSECKMAPEPEPKVKCTMVERGALESDYINELNAQARAIMSEAKGEDVKIDIFGEAMYSEMLIQIDFPNATVKGEVDPALQSKLAKSGDGYVTGTGIYQLGGPVYNDLSKVVQLTRESLQQPLLLFPRVSAGSVSKGKSLIGDQEIFVPDISASMGGVDVLTDLGAAGFKDTEVVVVDANQGSLNSVVRYMVVPYSATSTTKAQGQIGQELMSKTVLVDAKAWHAPGGWGEQELIHHNPSEALTALQEVVNQLKAEGRLDEIDCGIVNLVLKKMNEKGQKWEPQMASKMAVASGVLKANPSVPGGIEYVGDVSVQPTFLAAPAEFGAGGAGTGPMSCSIASAQAHAPQIMITLGMLAVAITGVGIVRRRKR